MTIERAGFEPLPKARKPIWPKVPADFVRAVLKGHSSLGLAFAVAIYLICLTGSIAVFANEFHRWENPTLPRLESAPLPVVQRAYQAAISRASTGLERVFVSLPGGDQSLLTIRLDEKGSGADRTFAADSTGRLVGMVNTPWTEFLTSLHINLHLPRIWGEFVVGLIGVALLSSLISGLLAHPRIFRDAFHLRLGGSRRLQEADLHNRLGVWALPFHLTISLTGALLGLTTLIVGVLGLALFQGDTSKVYALFLPPEAKEDPRPAPVLNFAPMFAQVARLDPAGHVEVIAVEHPRARGATARFNLADGSNRLADNDSFLFDRAGTLIGTKRARDNNLGEGILGSIGQLHFGWFGGGIVKVAYGLLGLGLTYLAASGVTIWLARRRDKGRPAPGWERIWAAVIWGQPLALAAAAGIVLARSAATATLALAIWGVVTMAMLALAAVLPMGRLSQIGRLGTAALLIALPIAHVSLRGGGDPIAWLVNAALLTVGLALTAFETYRRRRAVAG